MANSKKRAATVIEPVLAAAEKREPTKPIQVVSKLKTDALKNPSAKVTKTKAECILSLLKRPGGASMSELQEISGWQAHSLRGFFSRTIKKRMGLSLKTHVANDGVRSYQVNAAERDL